MFNKNKFNAMLLNHSITKQQLADYLDIKLYSLNRKIRLGGNFTMEEVRKLFVCFSKEEVLDCFFYCE